ncbi:MAG: ABC transporter permease, partial [Beijerinckiaceae bacterium]
MNERPQNVQSAAPVAAPDFDTLAPSPGELMRRRARSHWGLIVGMSIIGFFLFVAIFANVLAPHDPYAQTLSNRLADPVWGPKGSWNHILGTDALGRDVLSRLMYGARLSLYISFTAAIIAALIGTSLGIAGGYFGGRIDAVVVYLINVKLALPVFLV